MPNRKPAAGLVPSLWAAAALLLSVSLIAEIAATPTPYPGISSSFWTPVTSVTALFFGHGAVHGSFEILSILFGLAVILLASILAGSLASAFLVYCLGRHPHPLAAAILGAACALATEILLINLLCNWLQPENGIYNSAPGWGWWVAMGAWGITLGLSLAREGRRFSAEQSDAGLPDTRTASEGSGVGVAGHSPLLSADPHTGSLPMEPRT